MENPSDEAERPSPPEKKPRGRQKHPEGRPPIAKQFGLLIRRLRKEAGLSQEEFCFRAGYPNVSEFFRIWNQDAFNRNRQKAG